MDIPTKTYNVLYILHECIICHVPVILVLAANDTAFKKLSADVVDKLNNDQRFLHSVLEYHFLVDIYCSTGFQDGQEIETFQGDNVKVKVSGGKVLINNSTVTQTDIIAYNGVVQVIDAVLLPP